MSDLNAAAAAAGLSKDKRKDIDRLSKAMEAHRALLNLPANIVTGKQIGRAHV